MNQMDLKLSSSFEGSLDLTGWPSVRRSFRRGIVLLILATLSWIAFGAAAWLLFFSR